MKVAHYYRHPICIVSKINKHKIVDILDIFLKNYINLSVFGYNRKETEFWGKIICKNVCLFHFTLKINMCNNNYSTIIITHLNGDDNEFKKFALIITNLFT